MSDKRQVDPVLFTMKNMNTALTQHGVRNGDAGRRPQESLSPRQVLHPESAVVLAHPYRAIGGYDIYDNNQHIVPGFFANAILRSLLAGDANVNIFNMDGILATDRIFLAA